MRIELLPGMTNVVRFPVKRRARATGSDAVADGACTGGGGRGCGAGGRPGATRYGVGTAERRRRNGHADRCQARCGLSPRFTKWRRSTALW